MRWRCVARVASYHNGILMARVLPVLVVRQSARFASGDMLKKQATGRLALSGQEAAVLGLIMWHEVQHAVQVLQQESIALEVHRAKYTLTSS